MISILRSAVRPVLIGRGGGLIWMGMLGGMKSVGVAIFLPRPLRLMGIFIFGIPDILPLPLRAAAFFFFAALLTLAVAALVRDAAALRVVARAREAAGREVAGLRRGGDFLRAEAERVEVFLRP